MSDVTCNTCGHPPNDHAEFIDNDQVAQRGMSERRHCLHGMKFVRRVDHRGGVIVSTDKRTCECEKYVSKQNGVAT